MEARLEEGEQSKWNRLDDRVANSMDSILYTYKMHFAAADYYRKWGRCLDFLTAAFAALLTTALIWSYLPAPLPVGLAIVTASISGAKTAWKPQSQADAHYRAGEAYHKLFDEFRDFTKLDLPTRGDYASLESQYRELNERRRELNEDMPQLESKWYNKLDEENIYSEVETTPESRRKLLEFRRE